MVNIILCGGSGTRLWPISRTLMPKQFVRLFEGRSLFQLTVARNAGVCDSTFVVSSEDLYFLALDQLGALDEAGCRFLLEPVGRNTAPAIALACLALDADEVVLVTPSDHLVGDEAAYAGALAEARALACEGFLVTFGVTPSFAETGFGYIEADGADVRAFHEKPDFETASGYVEAGNYFWNSGMFCFRAGVFLAELERVAPEVYEGCVEAFEAAEGTEGADSGVLRVALEKMAAIEDVSIDCAVMERSDIVKVVGVDMGWSDLGSFDALADVFETDADGNNLNASVVAVDSRRNFVFGNERLVALVDVDDLIVIDTADALLVTRKGSSQKIREVVRGLREGVGELHHVHQTAHRPWGTYTVLEDAVGYKVKRIVVRPGRRLSLQKHFHRSEHWVVVSGTATVTVGASRRLVFPNESVSIRMGELHRLENEGLVDVVLIEAQVGAYTGEDDIVRVEDDFERF